jgi:hypothetical protein
MAHFCYNFIEFNAKPYVQPKGWYQCYEIVIFVIVLTNEKATGGQSRGNPIVGTIDEMFTALTFTIQKWMQF